MDSPTLNMELLSRVAVLENQQANLQYDLQQLKSVDAEINAKLDILLTSHTRYKGFVGGILLAVSLVSTFISATVYAVKAKWLHFLS